jgi:uncharacterized SAM-binding protein YcdF (DUF218 family)
MYAAYRLSQLLLQVELWIFFCLLAAGLLALRRRFLPSRRFLWLGMFLFYSLSIAPTAKALIGPLESRYPPFLPGREQSYDAIVVLTGGIRWQPAMDTYTILGTQSLDRLICGIDLLQTTTTALMVISGGVADPFGRSGLEASAMKALALRLGLAPNVILTETRSRTTAESAMEVRRLMPNAQRIVLTTAAYHLPRAMASFKKQGFAEVIAAPCDYEVTGEGFVITDLLPGAGYMKLVNLAIHEYVGIAVYWAMGKL